MNCLIIEDEKIAASRLADMLLKYDKNICIIDTLQSVRKAVAFFNESNQAPDLIFLDIQLSDGLSFEIFEQAQVTSPIIFTTAFDEYALKAFKLNSIDYLLKPIDFNELVAAIEKFKSSHKSMAYPAHLFDTVLKTLTNSYKNKFVVKVGEHIKVFTTDEIQCFYCMEKVSFLQNLQGRDYDINYSLDQLTELLDPAKFFRINRKYIIASGAIKDIISYSSSRLRVILTNNSSEELIISRERVALFKDWLGR